MQPKKLIKPAAIALGCTATAIAAPLLAPLIGTLAAPYFGGVLAGVITPAIAEQLDASLINVVSGMLSGYGAEGLKQLPGALSAEHNHHLEILLATAYRDALQSVHAEIKAGKDETLKDHALTYLPSLINRIETALKAKQPSVLFPVQDKPSADAPTDKNTAATVAYANRFTAEKLQLLLADEANWQSRVADEVEIALRRWLNEAQESESSRAAKTLTLGLSNKRELPQELKAHLRKELPHRIAHRISELVKREDFKESWIAFQRAHLQCMMVALNHISAAQSEMKSSLDELTIQIGKLEKDDTFVAALAGKLQEFLGNTALPTEELEKLLDAQTRELNDKFDELKKQSEANTQLILSDSKAQADQIITKGEENTDRLSTENEANTTRLSTEVKEQTKQLSGEGKENTDLIYAEVQDVKTEIKEVKAAVLRVTIPTPASRLHQLPPAPRDFVGRVAELAELRGALLAGGVTIAGAQGMGGVGKTALGLVLAEEFADRYPDAQIYLDLRGASAQPLSRADIMWHVVSSFLPNEKRPDDDGALPQLYNSALAGKRALLFYDNARDAAQVAPVLPPEHCLLLITSRTHFKLSGMYDQNLEQMSVTDAKDLLLKIAPRIGAHADELARVCGYLPLALVAAASALASKRVLTPADYLRRLRNRKKLLEQHDPTRDMTVAACFALSEELLTDEQRGRWRALSVFPATFDANAAAAIWETDADDATDTLAELEKYSLLDMTADARRFSLHDLAREFAADRLDADEREAAQLSHARYYAEILATADDLYLQGNAAIAEGLALYDLEQANIMAGQAWTVERLEQDEAAARLCFQYANAGAYILVLRQHPHEYICWQKAALRGTQITKDRRIESIHLGNLGFAYRHLGEVRQAIEYHKQALAISREIGDRLSEGNQLGNLGWAHADLGEARQAIEYHEQALAISREISDRLSEGSDLGGLGFAYRDLGEAQEAIGYFEQALVISREIGDRNNEGNWLGGLGNAYEDLGEVRRAIEFYEQALTIACALGDRRNEGAWLKNLGNSYANLGETEKAIELTEAAAEIFKQIESPYAIQARQFLAKLRGENE